MTLTGQQIIGRDLTASDERTFHAVDPRTGRELDPRVHEGSEREVDRAAQLARRDADAFGRTSHEDRARFLEAVADEIMALGDTLIDRAGAETALPAARLTGERGRTVSQLRLFAEVVREGSWVEARIDTAMPDRKPIPRPDIRSMMKAVGPVAVFGASNFPLAFSVAGGDTASALAAGCPVIVKGHPAHPGTSEMVARAIQAAVRKSGMPEGTFSMIQGQGHEVGAALVRHPEIRAVGFTGSYRGGKALFDLAAARPVPIPVHAEMGSTNPVFILPGALRQRGVEIAGGLADSVTLGAGQFCTNPGLVFATAGADFVRFAARAADEMAERPAAVMLHAGIHAAYEAGVRELASVDDVRLLTQNGETASGPPCVGLPRLLTTSGRTYIAHPRMEEEVFGPSSLVVACESRDEMIAIAESLRGHLTATIHGTEEELEDYGDLISILERKAGRIIFNGFPTGVEVSHAIIHGGPFPATTDSRTTSVGTMAIRRFLRPVCYQNVPASMLPEPLRDENTSGRWRLIDGSWTKSDVPG